MTTEQTADTFRKIDNLAAEARRLIQKGQPRAVVGGYLVAIQAAAQDGLRDTLAKNEKLEAYDGLLAVTQRALGVCVCHATMQPGIPCASCMAHAAIAKSLE